MVIKRGQFLVSMYYCLYSETIKNEYREMIGSVKAAWVLVGHKLKNHGNATCMTYCLRNDEYFQADYQLKKNSMLLSSMTVQRWSILFLPHLKPVYAPQPWLTSSL